MKYVVEYENQYLRDIFPTKEFDNSRDVVEYILIDHSTVDFDDSFDEMLDECYEEVTICGYTYSPSGALRRVDEVAYHEADLEYRNSVYEDMIYDLDRMSDNEELSYYGFTVTMVEDNDDEEEAEG